MVEKLGELAVILLLGSMVTLAGLDEPGLTGWLLVPVLLLVDPARAVTRSRSSARRVAGRERVFVGWFGVRGIGSLYYAAVAAGSGILAVVDASRLWWIAVAVMVVSIVVHGVTATPLTERLIVRSRK